MLLQIRYITKLHDFTTCTALLGLMSLYSSHVSQHCTSWWTINFSLHVVSVHKQSSASRPFQSSVTLSCQKQAVANIINSICQLSYVTSSSHANLLCYRFCWCYV